MTGIRDLEIRLKLCSNFIVKEVFALDPVIRRQWLYTYKGIVEYVDSNKSDLSDEQNIWELQFIKILLRKKRNL